MSEVNKKFTFSERVRLNDEMAALPEGPYVRWLNEAPGTPPEVERFVKRHKDEFIAKHGKKKGTSLAFAIGHTQFKRGNLEQNEIVLPDNLEEQEADLLNRLDDATLCDDSVDYLTNAILLALATVDGVDEAVATAGQTNINKGDWVQFQNDDVAKVQNVVGDKVTVKTKSGKTQDISRMRLSRIGKFQGKPAFGFLSPKQD